MAKYEVKDINKNGKIDSWEQAKYDAINKSSAANMNYDSPAKQVQPIVDPIAGANQTMMSNMPPQPSNVMGVAQPVFNPSSMAAANNMFGSMQMRQNAVGAPPLFQVTDEELKNKEKAARKEAKKNKIKLSKDIEPYEFSRLNKNSYFHDYDYAQDYTPPMTEKQKRAQQAGEDPLFKKSCGPLKQRNLGNYGGYEKTNVGDLIDETTHDDSNYKVSGGGVTSGKNYNVQDLSEIQEDNKSQFMTTLAEDEYFGGPKRPGVNRDTLRPATGKYFYKPKK